MRPLPFITVLALLAGCTLVLDRSTVQCTTDADCQKFDAHPVCSPDNICVASGLGPPGCFFGDPMTTEQYNNACSSVQCMPFDNCARLGLCNGAALPALVAKP